MITALLELKNYYSNSPFVIIIVIIILIITIVITI